MIRPLPNPFALESGVGADILAGIQQYFAECPPSPSARRALVGDGRLFVSWCRQNGRAAMPASPDTVAAFVAAARAAGRKDSSIRRYRCSIGRWHAAAGLPNPCATSLPVTAAGALAPLPPALTARLEVYFRLACRALAPATLRALKADLGLFAGWCTARGLSWLPASPDTVQAYLDDAGQTRKPATLGRYLSSIATLHRAAELPNPCDHWRVGLARKAHARERAERQRQARPLDADTVTDIGDSLIADSVRPIDRRDRALLLVGRDTLARVGELSGLLWQDLEAGEDGEGTILIRRSKTDQDGQGAMVWLSAESMAALADWGDALDRLLALPLGGARSGAVFRSLSRRGVGDGLSAAGVARVIAARAAAHDPVTLAGVSGHSLRVGGAQDLLRAGVDLAGIMQAGRWKTPQMAARYTERLRASQGATAALHRARRARTPPSSDAL